MGARDTEAAATEADGLDEEMRGIKTEYSRIWGNSYG